MSPTPVPLEPDAVAVAAGVAQLVAALTDGDPGSAERRVREMLAPYRGAVADLVEEGEGRAYRPYRAGSLTFHLGYSNTLVHTVKISTAAALQEGLGGKIHPEVVIIPRGLVLKMAETWDLPYTETVEELRDMLHSAAEHPVPERNKTGRRSYLVGFTQLILSGTHERLVEVLERSGVSQYAVQAVPLDSTQVHIPGWMVKRAAASYDMLSRPSEKVEGLLREQLAEVDGKQGEVVAGTRGGVVHRHSGRGWEALLSHGNRRLVQFTPTLADEAVPGLRPEKIRIADRVLEKVEENLRLDRSLSAEEKREQTAATIRGLLETRRGEKGEERPAAEGKGRVHQGPNWTAILSPDNKFLFSFRYPQLRRERYTVSEEARSGAAAALNCGEVEAEQQLREALEQFEGWTPSRIQRGGRWAYAVTIQGIRLKVVADTALETILQVRAVATPSGTTP